jgi:hypothetical protein
VISCLAFAGHGSPARGNAQGAQGIPGSIPDADIAPRRIITAIPNKNNPVGEMVIQYDGKVIPNDRVPFDAPDDWLKHLTVTIQNTSAKTIVAGTLQLAFTKLVTNPMVVYYPQVGMMPDSQLYSPSGRKLTRRPGETPISIAPGEYVRFSLANDYEAIRSKIVARAPLSAANSVTIDYGGLWFDGDLRWNLNTFTRVDPANPHTGRYIPVDPSEIMGPAKNSGD